MRKRTVYSENEKNCLPNVSYQSVRNMFIDVYNEEKKL